MTLFYIPEEAARWRRKAECSRRILLGLFSAAFLAAVLLCCFTRTRNAFLLQWIAVGEFALLGVAAILIAALVYRPARARAAHMEYILDGEAETRSGLLTLGDQSFSIPKSITARKVKLQTADGTQTLNLEASLASRLPSASFNAEVQVVRNYVAGFRDLNPEETASPVPVRKGPSLFRRILSLVPMFIVWCFFSLLIWSWIFSLVTDAPLSRKITLYVDGTVVRAVDLAVLLEEDLPAGVRMAQVRPFSHAMMDGDALRAADLYILPESDAGEYLEWLAPLPDAFASSSGALLSAEGVPVGVPVCDPALSLSAGSAFIRYHADGLPDQRWYLCFGARSLHVPGNPGALDDAAVSAAGVFLSLQ